MARPSKITDEELEQIANRVLAGESLSAVCREFGVDKGNTQRRITQRNTTIKALANQKATVLAEIRAQPVKQQLLINELAEGIMAMNSNLLKHGVSASVRGAELSAAANKRLAMAISEDGTVDVEALKEVAALGRMANEASEVPMGLVKANQDAINKPQTGVTIVASPLDERI